MTIDITNKSSFLTLEELSSVSGISKRTIKYYSQLGLVSPAIGETKAARYDKTHLDELEKIKNLQRNGYSLKQIQEITPKTKEVIPRKRAVGKIQRKFEIALSPEISLLFSDPDEKWTEEKMMDLAKRFNDLLTEINKSS